MNKQKSAILKWRFFVYIKLTNKLINITIITIVTNPTIKTVCQRLLFFFMCFGVENKEVLLIRKLRAKKPRAFHNSPKN
jgi:hypothetical protein